MTNALIIDTSTDIVSVAFGSSNETAIHESMQQHAHHSENILTAIDNVLKKSQSTTKEIDVIGVGVGPGMFTGLRVGITCAHSLCHALDIPLVYLSSLEITVLSDNGQVVVAKDARRNELYSAHYEVTDAVFECTVDGISFATCSKRIEEERLITPRNFVDSLKNDDKIIIDSTQTYEELEDLESRDIKPLVVDTSKALDLVLSALEQGITTNIFDPSVLYLRKSDAELSWGKS